jgi:DNA-binding transcriptional LysR family regulator
MDQAFAAELRAFAAVAEDLRVGGAAADLGLTRRTVSARLTALERRTGVVLVDRAHRRRIALTPAGEGLAPVARRLEDALRAAEAELDAVAAGRVGVVRVVLLSEVDPMIDGVLQALRDVDPGWRIETRRVRRCDARPALVFGAAEFAIGARVVPLSPDTFGPPAPAAHEALDVLRVGRGRPPRCTITLRRSWRGPHAARLVSAALALVEEDRRAEQEALAAARAADPFHGAFRWPLPEPSDGWH